MVDQQRSILTIYHKTFQSAINIADLDNQINKFIGLQTVDTIPLFRDVVMSEFFIEIISTVPNYFKTIIYTEVPRGNPQGS